MSVALPKVDPVPSGVPPRSDRQPPARFRPVPTLAGRLSVHAVEDMSPQRVSFGEQGMIDLVDR
jgi:hypothetical protein